MTEKLPIKKMMPEIVKALRKDKLDALPLVYHWLASLVVALVEERAKYRHADAWADLLEDELHEPEHRDHDRCYQDAHPDEISYKLAFHDFGLTESGWEWLKGRVGE